MATGLAPWAAYLPKRACQVLLIPALVSVAVVALLPSTRPPSEGGTDLILHAGAFGMLTVLAACAFGRLIMAAASILVYSGAIELAQDLVPYRDGSGLDMLANAVGVLIALAVIASVRSWPGPR